MKTPADLTKTTRIVRGVVYDDDFDHVIKRIAGGEQGLMTELIRELFHKFRLFLDTTKIQTYATNPHSADKLRRLLIAGRFTTGRDVFDRSEPSVSSNPPPVSGEPYDLLGKL